MVGKWRAVLYSSRLARKIEEENVLMEVRNYVIIKHGEKITNYF
jgi:hypothetical protein